MSNLYFERSIPKDSPFNITNSSSSVRDFLPKFLNFIKSFLLKDGVSEVVVPAFEGDMGILKDHISIISFLKPGLVKIIGTTSAETIYYVEDGIIEFRNNCLSILTSNIFDVKKIDKNKVRDILAKAEKESQNQ